MAVNMPPGNPYPSVDPGFAALPVEELLASNDDLIGRIRLCFGIDRDSFERDVLVLLRRYAACVHLLPATADNYFCAPGKDVGIRALQAEERDLEPQPQ